MPSTDIATVDASAPTLGLSKSGFVRGNDAQFQRTITGLLSGDSPAAAWLTIKSSPALPDGSGVQSAITLVASNKGVILAALCTFNLLAVDTLNLNAGPLYYYDIKLQVSPSNNIYTVEQGYIQFLPEVTDAPTVPIPVIQPPAVPKFLYGPNPPPNGTFPIGTHYFVIPPDEGQPAEWVFASSGFWRVISVVSYGH